MNNEKAINGPRPAAFAEHIQATPGVCGGRPRIAGTRIKVTHIVDWHKRRGLSADEIVSKWPLLTLGDVHAALAYYYDHRDQVLQELEEDEKAFKEMQAQQPSLAEKLRAKVHGQDHPVPPR